MRVYLAKYLVQSLVTSLAFILLSTFVYPALAEESESSVKQQIVEQIIEDYGYLDAAAYSSAMENYIASISLPDADSELLESGSCSGFNGCIPQDENYRSTDLPGVRDVKISAREQNAGISNSTFKVTWKKPDKLAKDLQGQYELSHYEVFLIRDEKYFERFEVHKVNGDEESGRLPSSIRFRHRVEGDYQVFIRAVYVTINPRLSQNKDTGFTDQSSGNDRFSNGGFSVSGFGFGETKVSPSSKIEVLLSSNTNAPLYQCLTGIMGLPSTALISTVNSIICPDAGITSLSGLQHFSGLQVLNLSNQVPGGIDNSFTDISPLTNGSNAPDLTSLNLSGVSGLYGSLNDHLKDLDSLQNLSLSNMGLVQIPTLAASSGLGSNPVVIESLDLSNNNLTSLFGLTIYDGINHLWLDNNNLGNAALSSSSPLNSFDRLITLSLKNIGLTSVQYQNLPSQVGFLYLDNNPNVSSFWGITNALQLNSADVVYQISLDDNHQAECSAFDNVRKWTIDNIDPDGGCMTTSPYFGSFCLFFTGDGCAPDPTLLADPEEVSANPVEEALGLAPSDVINNSSCGHQTFIRPSYCATSGVTGFNARYEEDHETIQFQWQAVPVEWGVSYYQIRYESTGVEPIISVVNIPSYSSNYHVLQLDQLGDNEHYRFQIRACRNAFNCGPYTVLKYAAYPIFRPENLQLQQLSSGVATITWNYPRVPPGSSIPSFYEVKPSFAVDTVSVLTVPYTSGVNGTWTAIINDISAYPAGAVQVNACRNTSSGKECGGPSELSVIPGPNITQEVTAPENVSLVPVGGDNNEFRLTWDDSNEISTDYYRIIDHTAGGRVAGDRVYAIEEQHFNVKRYLSTSVGFSVAACRLGENGNDICSESRATETLSVDTVPSLAPPANLCWYVDESQDPDGDALPNPDVNDVARINYLWTYNSGDAPQRYEALYTGIDVDIAPFGFPANGGLGGSHGFENAEYNPNTGQWYWHQKDAIVSSGSIYENAKVQVMASSKGVLVSADIDWPYKLVNDVPTFDISTRCSNPPPFPSTNNDNNQVFGPNPVGGPGDLQPGHWANDAQHRGNGWRFYWANQIRYDEVHDAFGVSYDLIGFWYTYKLIDGEWSPVWYFTRMQLVESDGLDGVFYEGALTYPRRSQGIALDQQVGTVKLWFNHSAIDSNDNQRAFIQVQVDQGDGLTHTVSHEISDIALQTSNTGAGSAVPLNRNDHYNGIWTTGDLFDDGYALANNDFFVVEWIEKNLHSIGLNFFDMSGEPIWVANLHCAQETTPGSCNPHPDNYAFYTQYDDFFTVFPGNNPLTPVPDSWGEVASHRQPVSGEAGRAHLDYNGQGGYVHWTEENFNASEVCFNLNVQLGTRSASLNRGSGCGGAQPASSIFVKKSANEHFIDFNLAGDEQVTSCELSSANPSCDVRLTWFTDDDFEHTSGNKGINAWLYTDNNGNNLQEVSAFCPNGSDSNNGSIDNEYLVVNYQCPITQAGTYTFVLKNYEHLALNTVIAKSRILVVTDTRPQSDQNSVATVSDAPINQSTANTFNAPALHDETIGILGGSAGVNGGAANYSIPINVPPGRQGMQPSVSLNYSSRAGNGVAGMGWSLSVGSSIHRCPQTIAQDGSTIGVTYDDTDRLCIDGQRLVRTNTGDYWDNGGLFRTEIDSFALIQLNESNDGNNGLVVSFTVRSKDNRVRTYGGSTDSEVKPTGDNVVVSAWLLRQESDQYDNNIQYAYQSYGDGEQLLQTITYTGQGNAAGSRQVQFTYSDRCVNGECDDSESWQMGYRTQQTQRLDRIRTCSNKATCGEGQNGLVRDYQLSYRLSDASGRLLLDQAQECAWQAGTHSCLPATELQWGDAEPSFDWGPWKITDANDQEQDIVNGDPMVWSNDAIGARMTPLGDFDGDGSREFEISDGVNRHIVSLDAEGKERWRLTGGFNALVSSQSFGPSNADGVDVFVNPLELQEEILRRLARMDDLEDGLSSEVPAELMGVVTNEVEGEFVQKRISSEFYSDLDNDGRVDIYGALDDDGDGVYQLAFTHWTNPIDMNTANLFDLIRTNLPLSVNQTQGGINFVTETPVFGDITGDGLIDVLLYKSVLAQACGSDNPNELEEANAIQLWAGMGVEESNGVTQYNFTNQGLLYTWPCADVDGHDIRELGSRPSLEDFNGDGVLDINIQSRIPDLFFPEFRMANITIENVVIPTGYQSATLRYLVADPASETLQFNTVNLWDSLDPDAGIHSDPRQTYHLPIDVNGDGLADNLFIANSDDAETLTPGDWYLQINQGGAYGDVKPVNVPAELAISLKVHPRNINVETANVLVAPQYASLIKPVDWNSDGRTDLLVPRRLDQAICLLRKENVPLIGDNATLGGYCPGNMEAGLALEPLTPDWETNDGSSVPDYTVGGIHFMGFGGRDRSTYEMGVVEFIYNGTSDSYDLELSEPVDHPIIGGVNSRIVDIDGDGIIDIVTPFGCQEFGPTANSRTNPRTFTSCTTKDGERNGIVPSTFPDLPYTEDFHCRRMGLDRDGIDCGPNNINSKRGYYITSLQQSRDEVLDLLKSVEDGFGNTSRWHYAPLSSSIDRPETDIPLYSVPNRDLGIDYLQNGELDHFYFTSSMYVVSAFDQFNGLWETSGGTPEPLFNTTYYGYEEAVFNNQGRGFQGFRKVLSEQVITNPSDQDDDSQNNLRSVSIFHQIFPLAGQIEATYTQAASITYDPMQDRETSGANAGQFKKPANVLSFTETTFACLDTNAAPQNDCGLDSGSGNSVQAGSGFYQPVMLSSTSRQYEPNASYASYAETTATMVYDRYGNVTKQTTKLNNVSAEGMFTHTQTVDNSYTNDASPGSWWLGRLDRSVTTGDVAYDNGFTLPMALPNGTSATTDDKIITQLLQYNAQRRPNCMYVVEGEQSNTALACNDNEAIAAFGNLQVSRTLTDYDNYGNPSQITVDANDLEAPRVTSSSYTSDGYFPAAVDNALGHTVTTIIEPREGQPTQVMDANDLITRMEYDHFGREIRRWYPNSSATPYASVGAHYAPRSQVAYQSGAACGVNLPPSMTYCVWTVADGAPMVWEAYDSLNRVIETRTQGFKGGSGSQNWIYNSVVYNGRGQTIAESVPEYTLNATHPLTYRYDVLGRQVFKQEPTTDVSNPWRYSHYLHNGLSTQVVVGNDDGSGSSGISCSVANASSALDGDLCVQRTYASNGWLLSTTDAHGSVTRFWYDAQGNSKIIQDAAGNYTTANYNQLGQRTQLFDPNMGDWSFSYNGLGEVIRQTDARSQSIDFFYDVLGRLYRRTVLNTASVELGAFVDEWEYDVAGAGLLHNETRIVGVGNGQSATVFDRTYNYDAYYRPAGYSVELDPYQYPNATQAADIPVLPLTARYEVGMEYDGYFARVKSVTYPQERFRLYQRYDQNGYLWQEGDSRNQSQALKSVTAMNPANQVTAETFGNGSTQTYVHHQRTFQMQNTKVNGGNLLTQGYQYDLFGNLKQLDHQQGNNALRTETFSYDHLHRLTQSQRSGVAPISYSYDAIGNLTEKDDFADNYSYGSGRPNAVSSVTLSGGGTANYGYDANGNMTTAQGNGNSQAAQDVGQLALKYDPYNKPFFIERNGKRSEFWYGPDDQRYFQLENGNQRTVYIDKLYEQIGSTVHKLYLGDYAVFTIDVTNAANSGINYLHKDRLGSIVSITDESGNLIANAGRSFDPFGKPREEDLTDSNGITHAPMPDAIGDLNRPDITTRGFTGHEQLNNLSLTHMNGRVYDYNLGRFLSVDPYIAFPEDSQSINPYSYLMNNPMSGTDPSGYLPSICGLGEVSRCEGGATEFLNGQRGDAAVADFRSEKPAYQLTINFSNGAKASVTARVEEDGSLAIYEFTSPENIGAPGAIEAYGFDGYIPSPLDFLDFAVAQVLGCDTRAACSVARTIEQRDKGQITPEQYDGVISTNAAAATTALTIFLPGPEDIVLIGFAKKFLDGLKGAAKLRKAGTKCSFAPGTLVVTESGFVQIEDVEIGDYLLSKDEITGEIDYQLVENKFSEFHEYGLKIYFKSLDNDTQLIETTPEHPFYVKDYGFVPAAGITNGMLVQKADGGYSEVLSVERTTIEFIAYNFTVAQYRTYFVGEQKIWVHNTCQGADFEKLAEFKDKSFNMLGALEQQKAKAALDIFQQQFLSGSGTRISQIRNVRNLGGGLFEIKGKGVRVYLDKRGNVLGYSNKNSQSKAINRLRNLIGENL